MTERPRRLDDRRNEAELIAKALAGADVAALRAVASAVLERRGALRRRAELYRQGVAHAAASGDSLRRALCEGQAMAYLNAAHHLDEAFADALGLWEILKDA